MKKFKKKKRIPNIRQWCLECYYQLRLTPTLFLKKVSTNEKVFTGKITLKKLSWTDFFLVAIESLDSSGSTKVWSYEDQLKVSADLSKVSKDWTGLKSPGRSQNIFWFCQSLYKGILPVEKVSVSTYYEFLSWTASLLKK